MFWPLSTRYARFLKHTTTADCKQDPAAYAAAYEKANVAPVVPKAPKRAPVAAGQEPEEGQDDSFSTVGPRGRVRTFAASDVLATLKEISEQRGRKVSSSPIAHRKTSSQTRTLTELRPSEHYKSSSKYPTPPTRSSVSYSPSLPLDSITLKTSSPCLRTLGFRAVRSTTT